MQTKKLYNRAKNNGCYLQATCVDINQYQWDILMKGATRADKKLATKTALLAGVIDEQQAKDEIKRPYYNPYNHFKTDTHIIYVHSSIEHFIRIN